MFSYVFVDSQVMRPTVYFTVGRYSVRPSKHIVGRDTRDFMLNQRREMKISMRSVCRVIIFKL